MYVPGGVAGTMHDPEKTGRSAREDVTMSSENSNGRIAPNGDQSDEQTRIDLASRERAMPRKS